MANKKEILTEAQVDKAFEIVKGFNIPDGDGEKRFDVDTDKPNIVFEKDFEPEVWKQLVKGGAVVLVEKPETEAEKEEIVFEKVEG